MSDNLDRAAQLKEVLQAARVRRIAEDRNMPNLIDVLRAYLAREP